MLPADSCTRVVWNLRQFTGPEIGGVWCADIFNKLPTQPVPQQVLVTSELVEQLALIHGFEGDVLVGGRDCKDRSRLVDVRTNS